MRATLAFAARRGDTKLTLTSSTRDEGWRPRRRTSHTSWGHRTPEGVVEKDLMRRWIWTFKRLELVVQVRPPMTNDEVQAWTSPSHLDNSRRFS